MTRIRIVYKKNKFNNKYIAYAPEYGDMYAGGTTIKEARHNLEESLRLKGYIVNGLGRLTTV